MSLQNIQTASVYSNKLLDILKTEFKKFDKKRQETSFVVVGSFARGEASQCSDFDYFAIYKDEESKDNYWEEDQKAIISAINDSRIAHPADQGAFGGAVTKSDLIKNIGGNGDSNENLTRRILTLLECTSFLGEENFNEIRHAILQKYVKEGITDHQMCRFLLNDIIRYYRTVCVDFEYKTGPASKSWGDRNIKLIFSRKLLYFSGILLIAETVQQTYESKLQKLSSLISKTPIERIQEICGANSDLVLQKYDYFLEKMSDQNFRNFLKDVQMDRSSDNPHPENFRNLKNEGHHFTWELSKLLSASYDSSHPIHLALSF
jgi:hypothetical protein